nr:uncharacterized protein LOC104103685 [Nicotiana tomentosiformis]
MVKGNKQTTNTAMEIREMRALIERLFGELNARQDKYDITIQELKESIDSLKKPDVNASSAVCRNSSTPQEENMKGRGKTLTATKPKERRACLHCDEKLAHGNKKQVYLIEDESEDVADIPSVDPVTTEKEEIPMRISMDAVVEYSKPYEGCCVTGYYGKRPVNILIGLGGTTHNFIDESFADKLGCDIFPIKPRPVITPFGTVIVTCRACNNFQLLLKGAMCSVDLYCFHCRQIVTWY